MNRTTNHHFLLHIAIRVSAMIALVILVLWYRTPVDRSSGFEMAQLLTVPAGESSKTTPGSAPDAVSASMFDVELWHTPVVAQPIKVKPIAKPAPLKLQLIAIIADERSGREAAVLYDPEHDEMRRVHIGSQIGGLDVREITQDAVELSNGTRSQRIKLETLEIEQ